MERGEELSLIRRAAAGDREAAGALIKAHQLSLYAYILRISGRRDRAEDVVQEAFVRVLTNLDRFDERFRFSTWLFTIARRVYLNMAEKKTPASSGDFMNDCAGHGGAPGASIEHRDTNTACRDALQAALMDLPTDQREVLVLFHQHEWPIWQIAERLSIPEGTVKSHLYRGRLRLREALERQRAASPAKFAWLEEVLP